MSSGDRDPLADDHEWQEALQKYDAGKLTRRDMEMLRGRLIGEHKLNVVANKVARDFLSQAFNPDHRPANDPELPNGKIDPETRRRRDEYRNRMGAQVRK